MMSREYKGVWVRDVEQRPLRSEALRRHPTTIHPPRSSLLSHPTARLTSANDSSANRVDAAPPPTAVPPPPSLPPPPVPPTPPATATVCCTPPPISLLSFGTFEVPEDIILAPQKGLLNYKKGDSIQFVIENLSPQDLIAYKYRNEKYGNKIAVNRKGKICDFSIPMTHLKKNELIIYIDTKPALGFKTLRK